MSIRRVVPIVILGGLAAWLGSCNAGGSAPRNGAAATPEWVKGISVGLNAAAAQQTPDERLMEQVRPQVFGTNEPPQPPTGPITDKNGPTTMPASDGSTVTVTVDPPKPELGVETIAGGSPKAVKPLDQRIDDQVVSLIDLLAQQSLAGEMPWRNYLALAALDALHPGAMPTVITPDQKAGGPLSADDRQAIESLREFFAGIAGGLYAHTIGIQLNAGELGFLKSFDIIIMVVLGGMGSISGAAIAAAILSILPEALRNPPSVTNPTLATVLGIAAVLIILFARRRVRGLIWFAVSVGGYAAVRRTALANGINLADYRMILYALALILMMIVRPQGFFGVREIWNAWRLGPFGRAKGAGP